MIRFRFAFALALAVMLPRASARAPISSSLGPLGSGDGGSTIPTGWPSIPRGTFTWPTRSTTGCRNSLSPAPTCSSGERSGPPAASSMKSWT
jgi:hypothetical protein